jgi:hypothetical protein
LFFSSPRLLRQPTIFLLNPFQQQKGSAMGASKFPLGQTVITRNAQNKLHAADVLIAMNRHASGDWGDVDEHDRRENELSLTENFRLLSVYYDRNRVKFWIITEADRSATTVLLPEDY